MILIVDFGSQTTHLIGRRLRELGVSFEFSESEEVKENLSEKEFSGIILSGGPASVYEKGASTIDKEILDREIPVLGICYGWQLMANLMSGKVESANKEYGSEKLKMKDQDFKIEGMNREFDVFMSHGDSVTKLPNGFEIIACTKAVDHAWVLNKEKKMMGLQFHPEVEHTEYGLEILSYFACEMCDENLTKLELNIDEIVEEIKNKVGNKKVICAVSGGVDSSVTAFLIAKAIGSNLIPVYIESGLMRAGTRKKVERIFGQLVKADLVVIEARSRFMKVLKGVTDPEVKRKIIGKLYIDLFAEEAEKHGDVEFLGQGTIRSDVIESKGSKKASKIKSHHNVGGLPSDLKFKLLEPMREYYKDEVRTLGRMADLPEDVVGEHPFPGPGYAIRIRGEVTEKRLSQVMIADEIVMEEIKKAGLYDKVFQAFAIMTGAYSTAVKGDSRAFAEVVATRAYESKDVMTARWAYLPHELLGKMSSRIVNEVPDVSRVVYDITTKPPATMEWE